MKEQIEFWRHSIYYAKLAIMPPQHDEIRIILLRSIWYNTPELAPVVSMSIIEG
jgi:hypothetical protein